MLVSIMGILSLNDFEGITYSVSAPEMPLFYMAKVAPHEVYTNPFLYEFPMNNLNFLNGFLMLRSIWNSCVWEIVWILYDLKSLEFYTCIQDCLIIHESLIFVCSHFRRNSFACGLYQEQHHQSQRTPIYTRYCNKYFLEIFKFVYR